MQDIRGQGTVEAAFVIPLLFVLMLMMLQPGIVLYDYLIMRSAAAEGARLMTTSRAGEGTQSCEDFLRNRLSAVPQHKLFHVHEANCTWDIQVRGDETSSSTKIVIKNELRPLPLLDASLSLMGVANASGNIEISVEHEEPTQPSWVQRSAGGSPREWVDQW